MLIVVTSVVVIAYCWAMGGATLGVTSSIGRERCKMALHPEYKIILLGDPNVGKTTYFLRIKQGDFIDTEQRPTASFGVEHLEHKVKVGDTEVKVST